MFKIKLPFGYKAMILNYSVLSKNYMWMHSLMRIYIVKKPDIFRTFGFYYFTRKSNLKKEAIQELDKVVRRLNGE